MLILPSPPPVLVRGKGRLPINGAILGQLPAVHAKAVGAPSLDGLSTSIESACVWARWSEIDPTVDVAQHQFSNPDPSVVMAVSRGAAAIQKAIAWHT